MPIDNGDFVIAIILTIKHVSKRAFLNILAISKNYLVQQLKRTYITIIRFNK